MGGAHSVASKEGDGSTIRSLEVSKKAQSYYGERYKQALHR